MADALPVLESAKIVRIVTATDDRTADEMRSGADVVTHLAEHGIKASFEAVKINGSSIGKVFEAYVRAKAIDLLVMEAMAAPDSPRLCGVVPPRPSLVSHPFGSCCPAKTSRHRKRV